MQTVTDATVMCSGVVWSCPLVFRGADVKLYYINYQVLALSTKIGSTNSFHLSGTWYFMSWYRYQRVPLPPPSSNNVQGLMVSRRSLRGLLKLGSTLKRVGEQSHIFQYGKVS